MRTWTVRALAAIFCAALCSAAFAGEVSESITNRNVSGPGLYYWGPNGHWERFEGDASGVPYVTERYPAAFQEAGQTIVSALSLGTNAANSSNPLTGAGLTPYQGSSQLTKWVRILVTGAPTNSPPWSIRFYGSRDGVTYAPLMRANANTKGGEFLGVNGGSDTLKVRGRGAIGSVWMPLDAAFGSSGSSGTLAPITLKYITAVCSADSTIAAANYVFTVEIQGRQQ